MVWEVKTNQMPNAVQKLLLVMDKRASGMNDSLELLQCKENLPSSPGYNSCDEHMELGKQKVFRDITEILDEFSCFNLPGTAKKICEILYISFQCSLVFERVIYLSHF